MLSALRKFWFGDVKLWISFWIYGFCAVTLLPFVLTFVFVMIGIKFSIYAPAFFGLSGGIVFLAYGLFVIVGVWRSANKYQGQRMWGLLAKVALIGLTILLFYNIITAQQQIESIRTYKSKPK